MKDFLLGWHERMYPLGLPYRLRGGWERSVARAKLADKPFRDFESVNFDKPAERAVAPTVAPSVRPVAEPASTREFRVGDRIRVVLAAGHYSYGATGEIIEVLDVDWFYAKMDDGQPRISWNPKYIELIPAQREQVASPSVRQLTPAYFNLNGGLVIRQYE